MNCMNRFFAAAALLLVAGAAAADVWETDYEDALATAAEEGRFLLLNFSGSDWCGWCIKLEKEVFSEREFRKYADDNLVCVLADFPRRKKQSTKLKKQNAQLKQKFGIRGFPTVLLLDPQGELLARTGYRKGGASAYVEHLETILAPHRKKLSAAGNAQQGKNQEADLREWTDSRNRKLRGKLVKLTETNVTLRNGAGKEVAVPRDKLSWWDQNHLDEWEKDHGLSGEKDQAPQ